MQIEICEPAKKQINVTLHRRIVAVQYEIKRFNANWMSVQLIQCFSRQWSAVLIISIIIIIRTWRL